MDSYTNDEKSFVSRELQIQLNKHGIITYVTSNCVDMLGYTDKEILNTSITKYLKYNFEDIASIKKFNTDIVTKDGTKLYLDVEATPLITDNKIEIIYLSIIDITKYKDLEEREKMFRKLLEDSKNLICRFEILPEPKFTYLSPSVENILGYTVDEFCNNPMLPFEITHPDDYQIQMLKVDSKTDFSRLFEIRFRHKDGHYVWLQDYIIPTYNDNGQLIAVETITTDVTHIKELEHRLEKFGYTDNLTGLYNKNYFLKEMDILNSTINIPVGIIVCDLDKLKHTNDSLGHSTCDLLIKNTAEVLQSVFNNDCVVSRTGGDEFIIIVKDKSYLEVERLYNELKNTIDLFNESNNIPIDISVGFAYSETSNSSMQFILDYADNDMYKNKRCKIKDHNK